MKQTRIARIAGPVAVAGLALAAFAPSALGHGIAPSGKYGVVDTFKAGKYKISVQGSGLTVTKGRLSSSYSDQRKGKATKIKADLKSFGEIDLKFDPTGRFKSDKKPHGCTGKPGKSQKGVWKGKIKFKGEGGYVKVNESSAKGRVFKPGTLSCPFNPGGGGKYVNLSASSNGGGEFASFYASVKKSGGKPSFTAILGGQKNGVSITRFASQRGKASAFTYNGAYTHAEVKPGGPFKGTGKYDAATKRGGTFTQGEFKGLKVSFLGKKNVNLNSGSASLSETDVSRSRN